METRALAQSVIDGILKGDILGTFDQYYADDVVMSENGVDERVGKAVNREYEEYFVNNYEFNDVKVGAVIVDGNKAAVEWTFDMAPKGGERVVQKQIAVQLWEDGKIVREDFYHA